VANITEIITKIGTLIEGLRSALVAVKLDAARPFVEALARAIGAEIAAGARDSNSAPRLFGQVRRSLQPTLRLRGA